MYELVLLSVKWELKFMHIYFYKDGGRVTEKKNRPACYRMQICIMGENDKLLERLLMIKHIY